MSEPNPAPELTKSMQSAYVLLNTITVSCEGVRKTNFIAPPSKPSWFDDLNGKLKAAQTKADVWINELEIEITTGVPHQLVEYGTSDVAYGEEIMEVVEAYPEAKGAEDKHVQEVHVMVKELEEKVQKQVKEIGVVEAKLKKWVEGIEESEEELSKGTNNVQKAEESLETEIKRMNSAIATLHHEIEEENRAISKAAENIGLGVTMLIGGILLAPLTGGTSLVVAVTGGIMVVDGAITWAAMEKAIDKQFKEIAKDQSELSADDRQLVALQGLTMASKESRLYYRCG